MWISKFAKFLESGLGFKRAKHLKQFLRSAVYFISGTWRNVSVGSSALNHGNIEIEVAVPLSAVSKVIRSTK